MFTSTSLAHLRGRLIGGLIIVYAGICRPGTFSRYIGWAPAFALYPPKIPDLTGHPKKYQGLQAYQKYSKIWKILKNVPVMYLAHHV